MSARKVRCPQCSAMVEYRTDNPYRPFCSERCKLMDLGAWAQERYAIAGDPLEATQQAIDGEFAGDPAQRRDS